MVGCNRVEYNPVELYTKLTTLENMLEVVADLVDDKHATLSLPEVRSYLYQ